MENGSYGKGSFLIANPVLPDPNFSRTVVLLCNHNDEGSFGLVINRNSGLKSSEVFASSELLAGYECDVFIGGPVSPSQVFYLVRSSEPLPGVPGTVALRAHGAPAGGRPAAGAGATATHAPRPMRFGPSPMYRTR